MPLKLHLAIQAGSGTEATKEAFQASTKSIISFITSNTHVLLVRLMLPKVETDVRFRKEKCILFNRPFPGYNKSKRYFSLTGGKVQTKNQRTVCCKSDSTQYGRYGEYGASEQLKD